MGTDSQGEGFTSRKFIITLLGLIVILAVAIYSSSQGIAGEHISQITTSIAGVTGAYVIGQGYADGQKSSK